MAASRIARVWILTKSGIMSPRRQPRRPSIGFCSRSASTAASSSRASTNAGSSSAVPSVRRWVTVSMSSSCEGRNSWSGGSMRRTTTGSPLIAVKMPSKSPRWRISSLAIAASNVATVSASSASSEPPAGALALTEHVLGSTQPDALGAVAAGEGRFLRLVGVRPDLHPAQLVGPAEDALEAGLVLEPNGDGRDGAEEYVACRAVEADRIALGEGDAVRGCPALAVVDEELRAAGDTGLADLAGDDRRVRRRAAARRQDTLRGGHAVEVVGGGFD